MRLISSVTARRPISSLGILMVVSRGGGVLRSFDIVNGNHGGLVFCLRKFMVGPQYPQSCDIVCTENSSGFIRAFHDGAHHQIALRLCLGCGVNVLKVEGDFMGDERLMVTGKTGLGAAVPDIGNLPVSKGNQILHCCSCSHDSVAYDLINLILRRIAADSHNVPVMAFELWEKGLGAPA